MKMSDIDKVLTQKVLEYINKGYIIDSCGMEGSQGESGRVVLSDGKYVINIYISKVYSFCEGNRLVLHVGKWIHPASDREFYGTIWLSDTRDIETYTYYEIDRNTYYTDSEEEFQRILELHMKRCESKYPDMREETYTDENNSDFIDIAVKYLKRKIGYKRVLRSDVKVLFVEYKPLDSFYNRKNYYVSYKGRKFTLR